MNFGGKSMKKTKYVIIPSNDFYGLLYGCKLLSNSLEKDEIIITQFNSLTQEQRTKIAKECSKCEERLKSEIDPFSEDMYLTCTMVDLNIIATKFNIDPATVCLCIKPPCSGTQKIIVKR